MNIVDHGIDIVEISPLKKLLKRREVHCETRCFTDAELISAAESGVGRVQSKESYMKIDILGNVHQDQQRLFLLDFYLPAAIFHSP